MKNTFWVALGLSFLICGFIVVNFDEKQIMGAIIESGLITEKAEVSERETQQAFMDFIATYGKSYSNSWEYENRYQVFKENYQKIADHTLNEEIIGFKVKMNQFGDLSQEEFAERYLGYNAKAARRHHTKPAKRTFNDYKTEAQRMNDIPSSVDWVEQKKVHSVKNQGMCGSCWAFSAIGAIESAEAITHEMDTVPSLSEQQLVDCSTSYGNEGCNGGLMDWAFQYAHDHSLCTEEQYPYRGVDQTCKDSDDVLCKSDIKVDHFLDVKPKSRVDLYEALAEHPVSVAVDASGLAWQFYFSGVVSWLCGSSLDHGVLAVGYSDKCKTLFGGETDCIKIKNSWGSSWGESGYIRIDSSSSSGNGVCGMYMQPSHPEVE